MQGGAGSDSSFTDDCLHYVDYLLWRQLCCSVVKAAKRAGPPHQSQQLWPAVL